MAIKGGDIKFGVSFEANSSQSGLSKIIQELRQVQNQAKKNPLKQGFEEAGAAAKQLESIITGSWNDKLNQLNLNKFNQSIKESYGGVGQLREALVKTSSSGQQAFNILASQVLNTNMQIKQGSKLLNDMATSMANTVKWGITSSIFNNITGTIQKAYYFSKDLDTSLNNIRIVTGDSADQMERFAKYANDTAKNLGRSTLDYTNTALTFYQQGLSEQDVRSRTETTLMAQNITGTGSQMADYLTSVWNGFKVTDFQQIQSYVDKLAKVADSSASNMSQLAIAMSKVASTANVMGVDVDQLNAQLATVIAVTRQAPESVGTAFKTIYTRLNDIQAGADDAEISLGNYSGKMAALGFSVLDASGKLRDTGQVIEQIGSRWQTLSREQQITLAQTMGGTRQVNQVITLFDNWNKYTELLNTSINSQGTLLEKNNIYLESTAAHTKALGTQVERTYNILSDTKTINTVVDLLKSGLTTFNDFIQGIGGGTNVFINFGATIANIFNNQIGNAINNQIKNIEMLKNNLAQVKAKQQWSQYVLDNATIGHANAGDTVSQAALEKQAAITQRTLQVRKALTQEQYNQLQELQRQVGVEQTKIDYLNQYNTILKDIGLSENTSSKTVQDYANYKKTELDLQRQIYSYIELSLVPNSQLTEQQRQRVSSVGEIINTEGEEAAILEGISKIQSQILKDLTDDNLSQQKKERLLRRQAALITEQEQLVKNATQAAQGRKAAEDGTLQQLKNQQMARERIIAQQQESAARQIAIQNAVKMTSGLVQAASSAVGGLKTYLDESSTASEKLNGAWAGISGTVAGVANMFMPGSGIIIQGIAGIAKNVLEMTGWWDKLQSNLMSIEERMQKISDIQAGALNTTKQYQKTTSQIEKIRQEWDKLSSKAGNFTDQEQARFNELAQTLSKYNEGIIEGYNERGDAIIANNNAIQDTLKVLDEQYEKIMRNTYSGSNLQKILEADKYQSIQEDIAKQERHQQQQSLPMVDIFRNQLQENPLFNPNKLTFLSENLRILSQEDLQKITTEKNKLLEAIDSADGDFEQIRTALLDFKKNIGGDEFLKQQGREDLQQGFNIIFDQVEDFLKSQAPSKQKIEQLNEELKKYTKFDTHEILSILVWNEDKGYSDQYNALKEKFGEDWTTVGEDFVNTILTSYIKGLQNGKDGIKSKEEAIKASQAYLNGLIQSGIDFSSFADTKDKILNITSKSLNEYEEELITIINDYLSNNQEIQKLINSDSQGDKNLVQTIIKGLIGDSDTGDIEIQDGQIKDIVLKSQQKIQEAINNIKADDGNFQFEADLTTYLKGLNEEDLNKTLQILKGIDLQGIQTFDDLKNAISDAQVEAEELQQSLSFKDQLSVLDKLSKGESPDSVKGGLDFLLGMQADNPQLKEKAMQAGGRFSEEFINAAKEQMLADREALLEAVNRNLEDALKAYDNLEGTQEQKLQSQEAQKVIQLQTQSAQLQSEIKQLTEESAQEVDKLAQSYKKQVDLQTKGKQAYAAMLAGNNPTDEQAAAVAVLAQQLGKTDELNRARAAGNQQYMRQTKEILDLQDQLIKNTQQQRIQQARVERLELEYRKAKIQALLEEAELKYNLAKQEYGENSDQANQALQVRNELTEEYSQTNEDLINKISELAILQNQLSEEEISRINKAKQAYLSFQDVMSSILQNQSATEDQINGLNQVFEQLISNHADLRDQVDLLRQVELAGTQEYKDALYQIRDALSSDLFGALIESAEQAYEQIDNLQDINIEVDPEGFLKWVDQVEDYLSVDKTITINVHSDAENMFNDMVSQMDNIQNAASKIGQNFIVAAQDLRTINSVFPGILNGMQQLQNGSIQLSRTAVQNAIATASTVAEEDLKSTQDQLQHQADLLRKKGDIYKTMAQIAHKLGNQQVQSEEERSELKAQMGEKLRDLQINNEKIASIEKANTAKKQTKASKQSSEVFVANQITSKRLALDAEKSYAQQVIQYQNMVAQARAAAASGQVMGFVVPEVHMDNVGYVAQTADISADDDSNLQAQILNLMNSSDLNREEWRRLGDQLDQRANVNYSLASDIDAMVATMSNREYNMQRGLNNVAAGHEYDYDPSENSNNNSNNNRNSSSPRSSTPRSSSPRSSSSSSPRSSSSSTSTSPQTPRDPDFIQFLQDQRDIYHDINIYLELLDEQLSRIKQKQDKLAGSKLIDALNEELQLLDRQIAAYKEKSRIAQDEMGELQARLRGAGVTFDENGQVSNYSTIMASQINYVNAVIQRYNHMTAEQQQQYKAVVEQVKENYQHFVQDMSRYDQLMSQQIPELENRIQQAVNRQIEISITKFNMTVDIELDLTKAKREWQDFENKVIRRIRPDNILENARSNYQSLFTYLGPGVDEINSQTVHIQEILDQLKIMENGGWSSIYGDNTAKALEDLKKYQQGLMNSLEEVEDIIEDIKQSIFDGIDQAQQAFDKQVDTFDYISDLINHDVKLINLIYGDKAYQMMSQYYNKQQQNDNKQVDFLRQQVNFWHNRMDAEKKRMLSLQEGSREWEDSKKVVQEYTKHWMDSVQNLNSAVEDSVSNLIDKYTNSIDNIFSKLQDKLTNGLGMETVAEEWELINKQSDMYYDTINSAYELEKLRDKYQQAIKDNEGNINAQKSLNTLMEQQLKMLKDKEHLSEYDVKRADLLLQIETKRLALQNTRASKTKLRLRRDSQGNYSYQYTADEQNIDKGQSELADLQNQLYNLSKTTLKNNLDDFYSTVKDYHKKLRDVYADTTLSAEQRQKKIAMLNKYYGDIINNMLEDNTQLRKYLSEDAFVELANMYNIDAENFTNMADQQKQVIMESLVPQWDSGVQTMIDKFVGQGGFIPTVSEALNELKQTNHSYQEDLDALSQAAGINFEEIANGYDQIIPEVQSLLEVNDQLINTYGEELDAIQQVIDLLGVLMDSYRSVREQAISAAAAAQGFRVASQESTRENALVNPGTNNPTTSSNDNLLDSGSYHSSSGGVVITHDPMATLMGGPLVGGWNDYLTHMSYQDWQRYLRSLPTFDTGGYTGSWGDEKRLAFVHEKQLILNHEDTKNLLRLIDNFKNTKNALETENLINNFKNIQEALDIESFINTFKNKTKQLLQTFSEPLLTDGSSIGRNNLLIPSNDTASNNTTQTVYLTANFPNANDRNEIEIALNNLLNRASQWVGR